MHRHYLKWDFAYKEEKYNDSNALWSDNNNNGNWHVFFEWLLYLRHCANQVGML
jgi:hypothetical protein